MGQSLSCFQYINGKAHDCANNGKHCVFGDDASRPDFVQGQAEQPLHSLNQTQVLLLGAASAKKRAKGDGFVVTTLLKSQEDIPARGNGDVADDAVKIPQLSFSFKVEVVLHHLEEHFDVSPFAADADNFLGGKNQVWLRE